MAGYKNFTHDFPTRCLEMYKGLVDIDEEDNHIATHEALDGREVTLLLAVACSGIVIPIDRFQKLDIQSRGEDGKLKENSWTRKEGKDFYTDLGEGIDLKFWTTKDPEIELEKCPDRWKKKMPKPFNKLKNGEVMRLLRNGLAHGNLWTYPYPNVIDYIWFSSEWLDDEGELKGYKTIKLSPNNLRQLVINWFKFIQQEYAGNDTE